MNDSARPSNSPSDETLEDWVSHALGESMEHVPTTAEEVARAEAKGIEFSGQLPPELEAFAPKHQAQARPQVVSLRTGAQHAANQSAWLSHAITAALSAAAAVGITLSFEHKSSIPAAIGPEPVTPASQKRSVPAGAAPMTIGITSKCTEECCAGSACAQASKKLRECPSQRRCIRCTESDHADDRYRIRIGRLAPTDEGRALLESANGKKLQTCVRVAGSEFSCTSAQDQADGDEAWASLPLVASAADLLSQLTVVLRWADTTEALAEWSYPIQSSPAVLCNGLAVKPKLPNGELVGTLSAFLDDTYFVELERAGQVGKLTTSSKAYTVSDISLKIFETNGKGESHFALVVGPLSKRGAEEVRWSVLNAGGHPRVVIGADYTGSPEVLH